MSASEEVPRVLTGVVIGGVAILLLTGVLSLASFVGKTSSSIENLKGDVELLDSKLKGYKDDKYDDAQKNIEVIGELESKLRDSKYRIDVLEYAIERIDKRRAYEDGVKDGKRSEKIEKVKKTSK